MASSLNGQNRDIAALDILILEEGKCKCQAYLESRQTNVKGHALATLFFYSELLQVHVSVVAAKLSIFGSKIKLKQNV